jgi:hypothetical protein
LLDDVKKERMLKLPITYVDYNGDQVTDVHYFNVSKPELIEMEVSFERGFQAMIEKIIETKNHKELIELFKKLILLAYGVKSDDGKRFIKSDQLREEFSQTEAYNTLFMQLATDEGAAANFLKGIMPKDMVGAIDKAMASGDIPKLVPTPEPTS